MYNFVFTLITVYAETTIQCICRQGYYGNGIGLNGCIKNDRTKDPCLNNPCGPHGVCLSNSTNSLLCQCDMGYTGYILFTTFFLNILRIIFHDEFYSLQDEHVILP